VAREPVIIRQSAGLSLGYYGGLCVTVTSGRASLEELAAIRTALRRLSEAWHHNVAFLWVLAPGCALPQIGAVPASADLGMDVRTYAISVALCPLQPSVATWARCTAFAEQVGPEPPVQVFASVAEATGWLTATAASRGHGTLPAAELSAAFVEKLGPSPGTHLTA
jgi:hypothetical protein